MKYKELRIFNSKLFNLIQKSRIFAFIYFIFNLLQRSRLLFSALVISITSIISGCSPGSSDPVIDQLIEARDFLNTQILVPGTGIANGKTVFNITIKLRNSNNTVIKGFKPTIEVLSGVVTSLGCTVSNNSGLSFCGFTTKTPGTKKIKTTNLENIILEKEFVFDPALHEVYGLNSGGRTNAKTNLNHTTHGTVGDPVESVQNLTGTSFIFLGGLKGGLQ